MTQQSETAATNAFTGSVLSRTLRLSTVPEVLGPQQFFPELAYIARFGFCLSMPSFAVEHACECVAAVERVRIFCSLNLFFHSNHIAQFGLGFGIFTLSIQHDSKPTATS